jgi:hypothetical protein
MALSKVYNGSSWQTGLMKIYNGTSWEVYPHYYNGSAWVPLYATNSTAGVVVNVALNKAIHDVNTGGTAYAWVGVNSDGDLYSSLTGTTPDVSYETYLDSGANSQVWVEASYVNDIGSGLSIASSSLNVRLSCTGTYKWGLTSADPTNKSGEITLDFYDAASGGTLLDTQFVSLEAFH